MADKIIEKLHKCIGDVAIGECVVTVASKYTAAAVGDVVCVR